MCSSSSSVVHSYALMRCISKQPNFVFNDTATDNPEMAVLYARVSHNTAISGLSTCLFYKTANYLLILLAVV